MADLLLSEKYRDFIHCASPVEFLEGTTYAGKTTVGAFKFMLKVAKSDKRSHIIAARDTGTAEKNIINRELGILDLFGSLVEYNGNGTSTDKIPHIRMQTNHGERIVYIMGYADKTKWEKALGGQYGCLMIDEVNTAHMDFVREAAMRCDYMMATLNPDDPSLPVYQEYVNRSRPVEKYKGGTPKEILDMLCEEPMPGYTHWFFSFDDNPGLTPEKKERIFSNTPKGTKIWKNKIMGLRGRATGLVFSNFDYRKHVMPREKAQELARKPGRNKGGETFKYFSAGLDTAYSSSSPDTIAMSFVGITDKGRLIVLEEKVYNNAELSQPLAPSDTVRNFIDFLDRCRQQWGFARNVFVDSADQATIKELNKYKLNHACLYTFNNAYKKVQIIDRINMQLGWMSGENPDYLIVSGCTSYIHELETYSWREDKDNTPEDGNDHMVNSVQYAWIPYAAKIGVRNGSTGKHG